MLILLRIRYPCATPNFIRTNENLDQLFQSSKCFTFLCMSVFAKNILYIYYNTPILPPNFDFFCPIFFGVFCPIKLHFFATNYKKTSFWASKNQKIRIQNDLKQMIFWNKYEAITLRSIKKGETYVPPLMFIQRNNPYCD